MPSAAPTEWAGARLRAGASAPNDNDAAPQPIDENDVNDKYPYRS